MCKVLCLAGTMSTLSMEDTEKLYKCCKMYIHTYLIKNNQNIHTILQKNSNIPVTLPKIRFYVLLSIGRKVATCQQTIPYSFVFRSRDNFVEHADPTGWITRKSTEHIRYVVAEQEIGSGWAHLPTGYSISRRGNPHVRVKLERAYVIARD